MVSRRRRGQHRVRRVVVGGLVALLTPSFAITALVPARAESETTEGGLRVIGTLDTPVGVNGVTEGDVASGLGTTSVPTRMLIDNKNNLGFSFGGTITHDNSGGAATVAMFDTRALRLVDTTATAETETMRTNAGAFGPSTMNPFEKYDRFMSTWAIDSEHQRIYVLGGEAGNGTLCGATTQFGIVVIDYGTGRLVPSTIPVRCPPGLGAVKFTGGTLWAQKNKLYVTGTDATQSLARGVTEAVATTAGTAQQNAMAPLLVMQLDVTERDALSVDWVVDLVHAGCGRTEVPLAQRVGDEVWTFCNDSRVGPTNARFTGQQGYLARVVLSDGTPMIDGDEPVVDPTTGAIANAVVHRAPTLGGSISPVVDADADRVLMATADGGNGNAVWLFNPKRGRFEGVITGGYAKQQSRNSAFGIDAQRGRGYLLTEKGILVAATRHKPLPAGIVYPVLDNRERVRAFVTSRYIAVASNLPRPRLFIPVARGSCARCPAFVVVEDETEEPTDPPVEDPDRLTTDTPEEEGKTVSVASSGARSEGARVLVTGGVPRSIDHLSLSCDLTWFHQNNPGVPGYGQSVDGSIYPGSCIADRLISPGNRDFSLAASTLEVGSSSGVTAEAGGLVFAPSDNASDSDVRRAGTCGQGYQEALQPPPSEGHPLDGLPISVLGHGGSTTTSQPPSPNDTTTTSEPAPDPGTDGSTTTTQPDQWEEHCGDFNDGITEGGGLADPREGVKGADGDGYPVHSVHCGDFGGTPGAEEQTQSPEAFPSNALSTSKVQCDAERNHAMATSTGDSLAFFLGGEAPLVSVARMFSVVDTVRDENGQTTTAMASARGIAVGPITIGEVRTQSTTRAHGRPGTTSSTIIRRWCGVQGPGFEIPGCVDPMAPETQATIERLNDKLGKLRLEIIPAETTATPGGYQALVVKDPVVATADAAVNDDDSITVPGMQVIYYNDGWQGRNRYIVQLANVRNESRYGISESPDFGLDESVPEDIADEPVEELQDIVDDASPVLAIADPPMELARDDAYEEYYELEGALPASASRPFISLPAKGRPFLERLLRVPAAILKSAISLLVNNPGQFALLFALWSLLATPVYLALRRRSFAHALVD